MTKTYLEFSKELFNGLGFKTFEFGICLGFRYSDFEFRSPYRIVISFYRINLTLIRPKSGG